MCEWFEYLQHVGLSSDQPFKPHVLVDTPHSWYLSLQLKVAIEPNVVLPVASVNSPFWGL